MANKLSEAELAFDLAKLELIVQQHRKDWGDDQIDIFDVAAVRRCAEHFGVTPQMAYTRALSLGELTWQKAARLALYEAGQSQEPRGHSPGLGISTSTK